MVVICEPHRHDFAHRSWNENPTRLIWLEKHGSGWLSVWWNEKLLHDRIKHGCKSCPWKQRKTGFASWTQHGDKRTMAAILRSLLVGRKSGDRSFPELSGTFRNFPEPSGSVERKNDWFWVWGEEDDFLFERELLLFKLFRLCGYGDTDEGRHGPSSSHRNSCTRC